MLFKDIPIQTKLMRIILLISGVILLVTSLSFFIYEVYSFRQNTIKKLFTLSQVIATNTTAALAFDDNKTATETLRALRAEPQIVAAALYDKDGNIFAQFKQGSAVADFPASPGIEGAYFNGADLEAFQPVTEAGRPLGTIYLKSSMGNMYERFRLLGITILTAIGLCLILTYFLSKFFQKSISKPILNLASTARTISVNRDFSVRAVKSGNDELGFLSDSFNDMLRQIQYQSNSLKEINQRIDKSEKFFRAITEQGSDMKTLFTPAGQPFYASPSIKKILGYSEKEFIDAIPELFHPDDLPEFVEKRSTIIDNPGKSFFIQARLKHKNGTWRWCEGTITNMLDEPAVGGFVSNFRDITAKKNTEEAIRQAEANYREIFDKTNNAIYILDIETGKIIQANKRSHEITGYTQKELFRNGGKDIFTDGKDYLLEEAIEYFKKATMGQPQIFEWVFKKKDGSFSWIEVNLKKATIGGKPRILAFFDEINERKKSQLAIQNLNEELERKVINRTVQLEIANKELEAFSYSVSHDLRAPLRAINGYAKVIWEDYQQVLDDEGKRLFTRIEDNAKKMGSLIDDLLEFSRMGRKEIQKSKVDMTALAELSLSEINSAIDHHADVKIHRLHSVTADPVMLKQVMINLLSNAIKYSSKTEKPFVEVRSRLEEDEIIYMVTDNGVGFNNEYVGKLFGVFQRLHLQSEFEGTGVGLALVKRIINKHGGRIWATGELNQGATFSFSLPILTINQNIKNGQFAS